MKEKISPEHAKRGKGSEPFQVYTTDQPSNLSERDYVIDGLLERENIGLKVGKPDSAKSSLALDMAGAVVSGRSWFGHRILGGRQSALFFAPERPKEIRRWLLAYENFHEVDATALGVVGNDVDLAHGDDHTGRVIATVLNHEQRTGPKAGLIVFDTVFDLLGGGDENHPRDMGSVSRHLLEIRKVTNTPILAVCHPSMERPTEPRGHKSLLAKADFTIAVTADPKSGHRWQVRKANSLEVKPSGVFTLKSIRVDVDTAPVVLAGGAEAPAGSKEAIILKLIADNGGPIVVSSLDRAARAFDQFKNDNDDTHRITVDRLIKALVVGGKATLTEDHAN
jgi:hypothetical protein